MTQQTLSTKKTLTKTAEAAVLDVQGLASLAIEISGTFTATLALEYTINGTSWNSLDATVVGGTSTASSATAAGRWVANVAGFQAVRVRCSAYTSGSVNVTLRAVLAGGGSGSSGGSSGTAGVEYNATPPTAVNGETGAAQGDINYNTKVVEQYQPQAEDNTNGVIAVQHKPFVSSAYSATAFSNYGAATNASVKTSACQLKSIYATNENAAMRYLQIFNKASAPTEDSEVPVFSFAIPAGSATVPGIRSIGTEFFGEHGYYLSLGFAWGISESKGVFNAAAVTASEHQVNGLRM